MVFGSPWSSLGKLSQSYGVYESLIVSSPGKTHRFAALSPNLATKRWQTPLVFTGATGRWAKMAAVHITPLRSMELSGSGSKGFSGWDRLESNFTKPNPAGNVLLRWYVSKINHQRYMNCIVEVEKNDLYSKCCLNLLLEQPMDFLCYSGCWIR